MNKFTSRRIFRNFYIDLFREQIIWCLVHVDASGSKSFMFFDFDFHFSVSSELRISYK